MRVEYLAGKRHGSQADVEDSIGHWLVDKGRAREVSAQGPDPSAPSARTEDTETKPKRRAPRRAPQGKASERKD